MPPKKKTTAGKSNKNYKKEAVRIQSLKMPQKKKITAGNNTKKKAATEKKVIKGGGFVIGVNRKLMEACRSSDPEIKGLGPVELLKLAKKFNTFKEVIPECKLRIEKAINLRLESALEFLPAIMDEKEKDFMDLKKSALTKITSRRNVKAVLASEEFQKLPLKAFREILKGGLAIKGADIKDPNGPIRQWAKCQIRRRNEEYFPGVEIVDIPVEDVAQEIYNAMKDLRFPNMSLEDFITLLEFGTDENNEGWEQEDDSAEVVIKEEMQIDEENFLDFPAVNNNVANVNGETEQENSETENQVHGENDIGMSLKNLSNLILKKLELTERIKSVMDILAKNGQEMLNSPEFLELDVKVLNEILKSDKLAISEVKIFNAACRWAVHKGNIDNADNKWGQTATVLGECVNSIRFPLMTESEFVDSGASKVVTSSERETLLAYFKNKSNEYPEEGDTDTTPFSKVPRDPNSCSEGSSTTTAEISERKRRRSISTNVGEETSHAKRSRPPPSSSRENEIDGKSGNTNDSSSTDILPTKEMVDITKYKLRSERPYPFLKSIFINVVGISEPVKNPNRVLEDSVAQDSVTDSASAKSTQGSSPTNNDGGNPIKNTETISNSSSLRDSSAINETAVAQNQRSNESVKESCQLGEKVLEVMFNKLSFKELKKCRRVCRKWEEVSRILMKKQSKLELNENSQRNLALGEFLRQAPHFFIPSKLIIDIRRAMELKEREGLKDIFRILGQCSFEELEIVADLTPDQLFDILGHLSTSLKSLEIWRIAGDEDPIATDEQIQNICPLLTKIQLGHTPQWCIDRIFAVCPNLTEIEGSGVDDLEVLKKTSGNLRKISEFCCSTQEEVEIFRRISGNLAELSLKVERGIEESVLEFVQSKKESLKFVELKFEELPKVFRFGQGFSQLTKLHLIMGYRQYYCLGHCLLDVSFSRDTPQLKYFKLDIYGSRGQNWKDLLAYRSNVTEGGRVLPLKTLTHLDLELASTVDRECADYLRQLFPSLTSFKIKLPTEGFLRGMWQMENLVGIHMDLIRNVFMQAREDYVDIEDMGAALFGAQLQDEEGEESILNLKKLSYLSIEKRRWNVDGNRIPDDIVRNEFGNMNRLTVLDLPHFEMTPEGKAFLYAHLPYLKQNDCIRPLYSGNYF